MVDKLTPEQRSRNMAKIKSKDTKIEIMVRRYLYQNGINYRKNVSNLPGKPDIVLKKYKTVIFVHGCFWHRHENCKNASLPKTRTEFWEAKFKRTAEVDKEQRKLLEGMGWHIIILWECEIEKHFDEKMCDIMADLRGRRDLIKEGP